MYRLFDYVGVQDYIADTRMGEINSISEAKNFYEEYLEGFGGVTSFEEMVRIYKGDIDKIKFSLKCNYIDSFLYDPEGMGFAILDSDFEEDMINKGLIGGYEEYYSEPELRAYWTCWLNEEYEMEPEDRQEAQEVFMDIKNNFWRLAYINYEQDKINEYKEQQAAKKSKKNMKEHRCPICGGLIGAWPGAISRVDNETEICSDCGAMEARVQFGF